MANNINLKIPFSLQDLPYSIDALEPYVTSNTLSFHHGKHHAAYVNNLNNLIKAEKANGEDLEQIILNSYNKLGEEPVFNNAAQVWNHNFFWNCMKQNGGGAPSGLLLDQIIKDFGSLDRCIEDIKAAAAGQFGSGWAWLAWDGSKLLVSKTLNAALPLIHSQKALLTIDVWEHAYYLDYQNKRVDYIDVFIKNLINWTFVEENFKSCVVS